MQRQQESKMSDIFQNINIGISNDKIMMLSKMKSSYSALFSEIALSEVFCGIYYFTATILREQNHNFSFLEMKTK